MIDNTEPTVLLKCPKCGREERVPEWILEEFNEFDDAMNSSLPRNTIECPRCNYLMYEPHILETLNLTFPVKKKKQRWKKKK